MSGDASGSKVSVSLDSDHSEIWFLRSPAFLLLLLLLVLTVCTAGPWLSSKLTPELPATEEEVYSQQCWHLWFFTGIIIIITFCLLAYLIVNRSKVRVAVRYSSVLSTRPSLPGICCTWNLLDRPVTSSFLSQEPESPIRPAGAKRLLDDRSPGSPNEGEARNGKSSAPVHKRIRMMSDTR